MQPLRFAINVSLDGYCARTSIGWRSVPYADLSEARVELVACPRRLRAVSRPVCRFPDARRVVIVGREEIVFPWHGGQSARCHGDSEQRSPRCLLLTSGVHPRPLLSTRDFLNSFRGRRKRSPMDLAVRGAFHLPPTVAGVVAARLASIPDRSRPSTQAPGARCLRTSERGPIPTPGGRPQRE